MAIPKTRPLKPSLQELGLYVSELLEKETGNILREKQQSMVQTRLSNRLLQLGEMKPEDYISYLDANYDSELNKLVGLLTTHHTFFFREFSHFQYIIDNFLTIVEEVKKRPNKKLRLYSAACSRGQEVYSLAILIHNLNQQHGTNLEFEVWGSDIDQASVDYGRNGVFPYNEIKSMPQKYISGNWMRGTGDISDFVKIKKHIAQKCHFFVANLKEVEKALKGEKFDFIFCRNVFIYFEDSLIQDVVSQFSRCLYPNGILVTGLSESLKHMKTQARSVGTSLYTFAPLPTQEVKSSGVDTKIAQILPRPKQPKIYKILAVDDSPSILKLLEKIFLDDPQFELVATAKNGLEAAEYLKHNKVDGMTLDIHMPEMDGVEYLQKNFKLGHPPVVVISSASRDDTRYAQKTLEYGASDFVEKPTLKDFAMRAEEIKTKLLSCLSQKEVPHSHITDIDREFSHNYQIKNPEGKARGFLLNYSDLKKVEKLLGELQGPQPPVFLFFEGNDNFRQVIIEKFEKNGTKNVEIYEKQAIKSNQIYICDFQLDFDDLFNQEKYKKKSLGIIGHCSPNAVEKILELKDCKVYIEDTLDKGNHLYEICSDAFPFTSFSHVGTEFLSEDDE